MLTASSETSTGTAGNDTFLGLNSGDLGNSDNINGGAGTDTLFAVMQTASTLRPVISNVENIEFEVTSKTANTGETFTANFDKSTGVTKVTVKNFTTDNTAEDTVVVSGVTTATSLKITDDVGAGNRDNNFTMTYDGVTGTADSASVEISSTVAAATLGAITVAGVETLTASSTGGAGASYALAAADATTLNINASAKSGGTATVTAEKVTTLNVNAADSVTVNDNTNKLIKVSTVNIDSQTADKTVTLTSLTTTATAAAADNVAVTVKGAGKATISIDTNFDTQSATNADTITVNAAANTGGVSFTTSATAANKVTGGTGNDTVTLGAALDKNDVIALGDGTADTLVTSMTFNTTNAVTGAYYSDTIAAADLPTISGVEVARINLVLDATPAAGTGAMSAKTASFASTVEINGAAAVDIGNVDITINNIAAGQKVKIGSNLDLDSGKVIFVLADATGTADSLAISTDGKNATATSTFEGITAAGVETISVDIASTDKDNTTIAAGALTFDDATSVTLTGSKITSATVVAKTGATIDASAVTGALTLTANDSKNYTVKGSATAATSFVMGSQLNATDVVTGGAAATDSLTATVTSLDATTGKLAVTGVETLSLTNTGTAVVDASGIVGATNIALIGAGTSTTLSKLTTGTKVTLGNGAGDVTFTGDVTIALADATGSADSLTIDLNGGGTRGTSVLTTAGIETIVLNGDTSTTANVAYEAQTVTMTASDAATINITGGHATPAAITLGTLNAATRTINASTFTGGVVATAAANTPMTVNVRVSTDNDITLGTGNDTVTVGTAALMAGGHIAAAGEIDGGAGSDTLTVYAKNSADLGLADNFEVVNVIVDAAADVSIDLGGTGQGADDAASITVTGGAAGKTLALTEIVSDIGARTIDASGVASTTTLTLGDDVLVQAGLSDPIVLKGGSSAADVMAYTASNDDSGEVTISGFETIQVTNGNSASVLNLKNVTGASNVVAVGAGQLTVSNFSNTQKIVLGTYVGTTATAFSDGTGDTLTVSRAANGTADILNLDLNTTAVFTVTDNQAETVNLTLVNTAGNDDHSVTLSSTSATTVNVVGAGADEDLTLTASGALLTTVNASALVGNFTYDVSNRAAQAMTITAGTGNDTIGMTFAADVLDGGAKSSDSDTLNISFTGTGGALIVDLSSATDQVTMFNGLANAAVQKNFENLSVANYTQSSSFGADITGTDLANTITGSAYGDTIRTGKGNDIVVYSTGNDIVTLGDGNDTLNVTHAILADNSGTAATHDGGDGTDNLVLTTAGTTVADADFRGLTAIETLTIANGTNTVVTGTNAKAAGIVTIQAGTGADTVTIHDGVTSYKLAGGSDVLTILASEVSGLVIDDSAATTNDVVLVLSALQDTAADWGAEEANLAAVDAADEWFFNNTTGVLSIWNENLGTPGITSITLVGVNDVVDHATNGYLSIDVAA
jgi:hypothetical protein